MHYGKVQSSIYEHEHFERSQVNLTDADVQLGKPLPGDLTRQVDGLLIGPVEDETGVTGVPGKIRQIFVPGQHFCRREYRSLA